MTYMYTMIRKTWYFFLRALLDYSVMGTISKIRLHTASLALKMLYIRPRSPESSLVYEIDLVPTIAGIFFEKDTICPFPVVKLPFGWAEFRCSEFGNTLPTYIQQQADKPEWSWKELRSYLPSFDNHEIFVICDPRYILELATHTQQLQGFFNTRSPAISPELILIRDDGNKIHV